MRKVQHPAISIVFLTVLTALSIGCSRRPNDDMMANPHVSREVF